MIDILRPGLDTTSPLRPPQLAGRWFADCLLMPVGIGIAAMLLRAMLDPWLDVQLLYVFAFPAVMISAVRGGLLPGILTAATCIAWSLAPLLPPTAAGNGSLQTGGALLFALSALVICLLADRLHSERAIAHGRVAAAGRSTMLQRRLETALGAAPLTAFDMDLDLRYRWIHSPGARLDSRAIGKRAEHVLDAETAAPLTALRRRVIQTGRRANHVFTLPVDGRRATFKIFMAPLRDDRGRIVGVSNVALDISDRTEAVNMPSRAEGTTVEFGLPLA